MEQLLLAKRIIKYAPIVQSAANSIVSVPLQSLITLIMHQSGICETDYINIIDETDLINKIEIYNHLLLELPESDSTSVKLALINIKNSIIEIENILKIILNQLNYNKSLWLFSSIRSYNIDIDVNRLKRCINKLDKRIDLLKTLFDITRSYKNNIDNEKINVICNYIESNVV